MTFLCIAINWATFVNIVQSFVLITWPNVIISKVIYVGSHRD